MIYEEHLTIDDASRKSGDVKTAVNFDPADDASSKREYQREFEGNRCLRIFEEFRSRHVSHCDQIRTTAARFSREDNHYSANRGFSTVYSRWDFSRKGSIGPTKDQHLRSSDRPLQTNDK